MGTLFDQRPRQERLDGYISTIFSVAGEMGYDIAKMTAADWHVVCDVIRTGLAIQSADALDEQLAGFGDLLRELASAISERGESE